MQYTGKLNLTTPSDLEIVMTRAFDAPRHLVFDAFTKPELMKRWLFGPPGWSLAVCDVDLRVGGAYRYQWNGPEGERMGISSVYLEILPPERIATTERFDDAWYPGEATGTIVLEEQGNRTLLTQTMRYESAEARDIALKSGMEQGLNMSYDRLAEVLAPVPAGE